MIKFLRWKTSSYFKLEILPQHRYAEKLKTRDIELPDPMDSNLRDKCFNGKQDIGQNSLSAMFTCIW